MVSMTANNNSNNKNLSADDNFAIDQDKVIENSEQH